MSHKPFILAVATLTMLAVATDVATAQQQTKSKSSKHPTTDTTTTPVLRPGASNPCAQFGAGFARAPGSDTCVRIGGYVGVDAGGRF